jgi:hypothetical protein
MKPGDLVKFSGDDAFYVGRTGVVCRLYNTHGLQKNGVEVNTHALVYYPGAERQARANLVWATNQPRRHGPIKSGLHPMKLEEIEVISASR